MPQQPRSDGKKSRKAVAALDVVDGVGECWRS